MYDIIEGIKRIDDGIKEKELSWRDNHAMFWSDFEAKKDEITALKVDIAVLALEYHPVRNLNEDDNKQYHYNMGVLFKEIIKIIADYEKFSTGLVVDYSVIGNRFVIVMNTAYKVDLDEAINLCGKIRSLNDILNWRAEKEEKIGGRLNMGMSFGSAWLSKLKDVETRYGVSGAGQTGILYGGECLNNATSYLGFSKNDLVIDNTVYKNLRENYQNLFMETIYEDSQKDLRRGEPINIMFRNEMTR